MAFRGRGGGRGGRGGRTSQFDRYVPPVAYELFPENSNLPRDPIFPLPPEEQALITGKARLEKFLKDSCYYLEEAPKSKKGDKEIEQYSDRFKSKAQAKRESLALYLKLTPSNFPPELIQGSKRVQPDNKKLRWGRDSDTQLLDMFEKLEENTKGDEIEGKEKRGESEDEEDPEEEGEEESSDDGDYNQNIDFDDDEDDLNMEEEADEDYYE